MGAESKIEWTDATWNPVTGCTRVSKGCRNCYMARTVPRQGLDPWKVVLHPDRLEQPLKWRRPRRIFVNSLSDLFHEDVPIKFISRVWLTMQLAPQHTFQILTKRPGRMLAYMREFGHYEGKPLPNVWLGVSAENQETADERIPLLLQTPAAVRFVSAEPLLGPVSFRWAQWEPFSRDRVTNHLDGLRRLDWIIVGGESGPGARPMHPYWARSIRDQCQAAGVPFFFKQWGEWTAIGQMPNGETPGCSDYHRNATSVVLHRDGQQNLTYPPGAMTMLKIGKKFAGSTLDGREHKEWPTTAQIEEGE
jgi:protein gp37